MSPLLPPINLILTIHKVGYDLVNIQIPLYCVDSDIAARIQWAHGNLWVFCVPPLDWPWL